MATSILLCRRAAAASAARKEASVADKKKLLGGCFIARSLCRCRLGYCYLTLLFITQTESSRNLLQETAILANADEARSHIDSWGSSEINRLSLPCLLRMFDGECRLRRRASAEVCIGTKPSKHYRHFRAMRSRDPLDTAGRYERAAPSKNTRVGVLSHEVKRSGFRLECGSLSKS